MNGDDLPGARASTTTITVLASVLLIGVVSFGFGFATFAYFQDTDASSANTIQSGTLNVTIDGTDGGVTNSFSISGGKPLDSTTKNYTIRNGGSLAADHLQVNSTFTENDPTGTYDQEPGDADLAGPLTAGETATYVEVMTLTYHDGTGTTDVLASVADANGNGIKDLADAQNSSALDDLTPPAPGEGNATYLEITVRIASDDHGLTADDENVMGDGIDVSLHFTLMQDSSQD